MTIREIAASERVDPLAAVIDEQLSTADATVRELLADCPAGDPMQSRLTQVHQTMQRLAALTGQFSSLGRRRPPRATPLDLNNVVRQMVPSLERLLGPFTSLRTALQVPGLWAAADRGQVEQVVLGLVINARESLPLGGAVQLATEHRRCEFRQNYRVGSLPPGAWAVVQVSDNGAAIDEATIRTLLETAASSVPFDSSLSLRTVAAVVRGAGGQVVLDVTRSGGTILSACFPAVAAPRLRQPATGVAGAVLVVTDDEWSRLSSARALRRAGYGVLEAADAETAMELLADVAGTCVRVVVVDARLTTNAGRTFAEQLCSERPDLDLLVTGAAPDAESGGHATRLNIHQLAGEQLVHAVRERVPASG